MGSFFKTWHSWFGACVLLLCAFAISPGAQGSTPQPPRTALEPLAIKPVPALREPGALPCLDLYLAVDDSTSERWSDPTNRRLSAAMFALRMLGSISGTGLVHRAAVVRFGTAAPAEDAEGPVDLPRGLPRLTSVLEPRHNLGGTSFPAVFQRVRALIRGASPAPVCRERRTTVFVITDGAPNTVAGSVAPTVEFTKIERALAGLRGARVYLLGTDGDGSFSRMTPYWRALGVAGTRKLDGLGPLQLERVYSRVLARELGLPASQDELLTPRKSHVQFAVPAFSERLLLVSFSSDGGSVAMTAAGGRNIGATHGRAGVLTVERPSAGAWSLRLRGRKRVLASAFTVPGLLRLVSPSRVTPEGRDLTPAATLLTHSGRPLVRSSDPPPFVEARVVGPGVPGIAVPLVETAPGHFEARHGVATRRAGTYRVTLAVRAAGEVEHRVATRAVAVERTPYLAVTSLSDRARAHVRVEAELRLGGHTIDASHILGDSPEGAVIARLRGGRGRPEIMRLHWQGGARFAATSRTTAVPGREASVVVSLAARDRAGRPIRDTIAAAVTPHLIFWDHVRDALAAAARIVSALLGLVLLGYAGWYLRRRPIRGDYLVPPPGASTTEKADRMVFAGNRMRVRRAPRLHGPHVWVYARRGRVVAVTARVPVPWGGSAVERVDSQGPALRKRVLRERRAA